MRVEFDFVVRVVANDRGSDGLGIAADIVVKIRRGLRKSTENSWEITVVLIDRGLLLKKVSRAKRIIQLSDVAIAKADDGEVYAIGQQRVLANRFNVRAKLEGKPIAARKPAPSAKVVDLMQALKQSAAASGRPGGR